MYSVLVVYCKDILVLVYLFTRVHSILQLNMINLYIAITGFIWMLQRNQFRNYVSGSYKQHLIFLL